MHARTAVPPWHTAFSFVVIVALGSAGTAADRSEWWLAGLLLVAGLSLPAWIGALKLGAARRVRAAKDADLRGR